MWLERFSGQSTPSQSPPPTSRTPRRSIQIQRPGLLPRSGSSSQLASNSHVQLPSSTRILEGSGLKYQLENAAPSDVEDSIASLQRILDATGGIETGVQKPSPATLAGPGLNLKTGFDDLQNFADEEGKAGDDEGVSAADLKSEQDFLPMSSTYKELHESVTECDGVLGSVEQYLTSFQVDLAAVSAEIETLQTRSLSLNSKLQNRRTVEKLLGPVVEQISLSPRIVKKISEGTIDEAWVRALEELQTRAKLAQSDEERLVNTRAFLDLMPLLDDLSNRAVERIRDHFAAKIRALRSPNVNAQVLQQQGFLKYKSLFAFLAQRQPKLAEEISRAYANTMRWYYVTNFTRYQEVLVKLRVYVPSRGDLLLGDVPSTVPTPAANTTAAKQNLSQDPFTLGRRLDILRQPADVALPASTAEDLRENVNIEIPFMHMNMALLDNVSVEYTFLTAFLSPTLFGPNKISQQLTTIFGPTLDIGYTLTKLLIKETYDGLGILLMIRMTQHFAFTLQRRRVPTLDSYVNGTLMLLWPRFQQILDAHCESLKRLASTLPSRPSGVSGGAANAAFASLSSAASIKMSSSQSTAPHKITQRFANLLRGILALSAETRDDEPVGNSVARLRESFDAWTSRMAQGYALGDKGRRERERFVNSNYGLVTAVLDGIDVTGRLADDCRAHFEGAQGIV